MKRLKFPAKDYSTVVSLVVIVSFLASLPVLLRAANETAVPEEKSFSEYDWDEDTEPSASFVPQSAEKKAHELLIDTSKTASLVARLTPEVHVTHKAFRDTLSPQAWTNFLDSLDYEHIYFTQEDLAEFEPARTTYLSRIAGGRDEFPKAVFARYVQRVKERADFVSGIISNQFDHSTTNLYTWRRHKLPRPRNRAEQDEIWTQRIQNSLLGTRVSAELNQEEASNRLEQAYAKIREMNLSPEETQKKRDHAYTAFTNDCVSVEQALSDARKEILEGNENYVGLLRDSDQEFWLSRWLSAATEAYDPHSGYMSPAIAEDFDIDMSLSLQGIGATLQIDAGAAKIVELVPGSPAERDDSPEHLVPGDRIIAVAQGNEEFVDIRHWPLYKSVRLIRGPKGSAVRLRVIPAAAPSTTKIVTLVREEIKMEEQAAEGHIETVTDPLGAPRKIGFIHLPTFYSSNTAGDKDAAHRSATEDVAKLIAEFNEQEIEGLVLDLRGNGGGSLQEAITLTGLFIRTGPVVVVRENRRGIAIPDNNPAIAYRGPMVVLVDRISASASEIVAAALQDYGRALVLGDASTHGKGTVQTVLPLEDGALGTLKITTALFYRINGASTQIRGVRSDIHLPSFFEGYSELGEDKLPGALPWTHISPSPYRPLDNLTTLAAELRERSAARLATNSVWNARMKVLERFKAFNASSTQTLNLEDRRKRAREDAELTREVSRLSSNSDEDDKILSYLENSDDLSFSEAGIATPALGNTDAAPAPVKKEKKLSREEKKARARKSDIVLDESLNILVDLIDLHQSRPDFDANASPLDFLDALFR